MNGLRWSLDGTRTKRAQTHTLTQNRVLFIILLCLCFHANFCVATNMAEVHWRLAEANHQEAQHSSTPHKIPALVFVCNGLEIEEQQ